MDYIDDRLKKQTKWYEESATKNKRRFMNYQTLIIILGALIPVLVVVLPICSTTKDLVGPVSAIISAFISILAGLDKLYQPQPNWFNYRANEEMLKKEEWLYKYRAGPYKNLKDDKEADRLLVERTESIISADIARTFNSDKSKNGGQDKTEVDQPVTTPLNPTQTVVPEQSSADNGTLPSPQQKPD